MLVCDKIHRWSPNQLHKKIYNPIPSDRAIPKAGLDHARRQWIRCNLDGPSERVTRNSMWNKLYFMQTNIFAFIEFHHNWNRPCNKQIEIQSPANICNSLKMKWHQPGWNTWTLKGICSKQSCNFFSDILLSIGNIKYLSFSNGQAVYDDIDILVSKSKFGLKKNKWEKDAIALLLWKLTQVPPLTFNDG